MVDFAQYSDRHHTSFAHFPNNGKWNSAALETSFRLSVIEKVYQHAKETKPPILCIIDDTMAGLKSNRILYPCGIRTPLSKFASNLHETDAGNRLFSIGKRKYWVFRYDGQINGTNGAAVILTYPENSFGNSKTLRAFLCTNSESVYEALACWDVFTNNQGELAPDKYQLHSATGIRRFWLVMSLTHFLCCVGRGILRSFQMVTHTGRSLFCVTLCIMFITAARMECLSLC